MYFEFAEPVDYSFGTSDIASILFNFCCQFDSSVESKIGDLGRDSYFEDLITMLHN